MAFDLSTLDPERIPDMAATAFDEADRDYLIPEFQAPDMKASYKDLGMLALPISARLPKPMGSKVVAGLNMMTMAMRAMASATGATPATTMTTAPATGAMAAA